MTPFELPKENSCWSKGCHGVATYYFLVEEDDPDIDGVTFTQVCKDCHKVLSAYLPDAWKLK